VQQIIKVRGNFSEVLTKTILHIFWGHDVVGTIHEYQLSEFQKYGARAMTY